MRRIYVCTIGVCMLLLAGSSCKKAYDFIREHPDDHLSFCRITHIRGDGFFAYPGATDTLTFFYNAKGDPTDMLDRSPARNSQDQHWRYDNRGRLIAYYITFPPPPGYPPPTGAVEYHKYAYPKPDWVVDTVIYYGTPEFPPLYKDAFDGRIDAHLLDSRGRIIRTYHLADLNPPTQPTTEYKYDANGNLEVSNYLGAPYPPGTTYDHMINPYRTNYVFQFTYKDFSLNNLIAIDPASVGGLVPEYNQFGLPVTLPVPSLTIFTLITFDAMNSNPIEIDYACSMPKGPIDY